MELREPVVPEGTDPQIDDPQVGQTRGDQQPTEARRVAQVALVQVEAPALLVGEEGLDMGAFPVVGDGGIQIAQVRHQVERVLGTAAPRPPAG